MLIENQVAAAAQSFNLKQLGITSFQAPLFWQEGKLIPIKKVDLSEPFCPAFTCAELGEMLPSEIMTEREPGLEYRIWVCSDEMNYEVAFPNHTEAAAKADMLIWLLEKGHLTAAEANEALAAD